MLTPTVRVAPASTWLAERGGWLASLGRSPMLRWVTVTVDSAPEPGSALADAAAVAVDPDSWRPGARHPGRGKYLIKTGERLGIPVQLTLVGPEFELYDTDPKFDPFSGRNSANPGVDAS